MQKASLTNNTTYTQIFRREKTTNEPHSYRPWSAVIQLHFNKMWWISLVAITPRSSLAPFRVGHRYIGLQSLRLKDCPQNFTAVLASKLRLSVNSSFLDSLSALDIILGCISRLKGFNVSSINGIFLLFFSLSTSFSIKFNIKDVNRTITELKIEWHGPSYLELTAIGRFYRNNVVKHIESSVAERNIKVSWKKLIHIVH